LKPRSCRLAGQSCGVLTRPCCSKSCCLLCAIL
jgi:hypothetical protein